MRAGLLRHRVTIQAPRHPENERGEAVAEWADVATVWASVEPLIGRERWTAQQVMPETTHRVRIRYRPGLTAAHRLKFGDRILHIDSVVDPQERHRELEILAREEPMARVPG